MTAGSSITVAAAAALLLQSAATLGFLAPAVVTSSSLSRRNTVELRPRQNLAQMIIHDSLSTPSQLRMSADDEEESPKEKKSAEDTKALAATAAATNTAPANKSSSSNKLSPKKSSSSPATQGFSLILLPTLLFKFTIVLIVKFATDVVVYPLLYLYRWALAGKKKIVEGFRTMIAGKNGGEGINGKVNGTH
jgi:hypothetical protein